MDKIQKIENFKNKIRKEFFARKQAERATWDDACRKAIVPEFIIEEFVEEINWDIVCTNQVLSEDFIRRFKNSVNWKIITRVQRLSEAFIEEMADYIVWFDLLYSRELTVDFLQRNESRFEVWINNWYKKTDEVGTLTRQKNWFDNSHEGAIQKQTLLRNLLKIGYVCVWDEHYNSISEEDLDFFLNRKEE